MLGFRGHFSTKSRSYSTTLGTLRDARRLWRTEQARAHAGRPESDPDTTLVVGHWAYQGSGYSPGAALLAAHVWHRRELERRFIDSVPFGPWTVETAAFTRYGWSSHRTE